MNTLILENISSTDVSIETPIKEFNHIQKYYELKADYYNFLLKKGSKKYTYNLPKFNEVSPFKKTSIISERSNLPLRFRETEHSLIITIMDHEQKKSLREISIKIKDDMNIDIESYNIKKELLLFKLNSIKTKKLSIDAKKDITTRREDMVKLSDEWGTLKKDIATFQSKFSKYKIRRKQKETIYNTHYTYNIHTNDLNNYNDIRTDLLIKHLASSTYNAASSIKYYILLKFLSYLKPSIQIYPSGESDLCLISLDDNVEISSIEDNLIGSLVYKKGEIIDINNIYVVIKRLSKKSIKVVNIEGEEFEFSNSEYGDIKGRVNIENTLLKQLYEDVNIINMNQKVDNPVCKVKDINPIPSSYTGLVYSGKGSIIYIPKSELRLKKKPKLRMPLQEIEIIPKYKLIEKRSSFDSFITYTSDELFIYKGAISNEPGELFLNALTSSNILKKEACTSVDIKQSLKSLSIPWREILSIGNIYIHKNNGEVLPIIIDSLKFASVSHYLLYKKYQVDDKSDNFLLEGVLGSTYVSIDEALYEDYTISPEWVSVDDTIKIKNSSISLAKAQCAKYIQFHEYKSILLDTKDSKLIVPVDNNTLTGEYQIDKELIMVRTLIRNGDNPLFYMSWNIDFVTSVQIHKDIMSKIIMPDPIMFDKNTKSEIKTSSATSLSSSSPASLETSSSAVRDDGAGAVATKEQIPSPGSPSKYTPPMSPLLTAASTPPEDSYPDTAFDYRNHYMVDDDAKVRKLLDSDDTFNFQFQTGTLRIDINNGKKSVTIDTFHHIFYQQVRAGNPDLTYDNLEEYHDYIQWLFPNSEKSRFNSDSRAFLRRGELEMLKTSQLAQDNMLKSFITMAKFYGGAVHFFESLIEEEDRSASGASVRREQVVVILPGIDIRGRLKNLNAHTHNQSRITRILKYLGEMGSEHLKIAFIEFLIFHICHNPLKISWNSSFTKSGRGLAALVFWINTVFDDDERKRLFSSFSMCYGRDKRIRPKLLKGLPKEFLLEWKVDEEGSYSQTSWSEAQLITGLAVDTFRDMFRVTRKLNIVDATASIGGNTVSFLYSDDIKTVLAIEPNNTRARYLDINIDTFIRHMDKKGTKHMRDKIRIENDFFYADSSIYNGETIFGSQYNADIVFIDPPWGGVDYEMEHNPARVLGDVSLEEICDKLLGDTSVQLVILKLPVNFLIDDFTRNLATQNLLIEKMLEGVKINIYMVYSGVSYLDDDDERWGEDLEEQHIKRQEIEDKYRREESQGGGRKKHYKRRRHNRHLLKKHSTFPYIHGDHKYHMACSYNKVKDSHDILGFYNSKKGNILYKNECEQYEVLKEILSLLTKKCQEKELDLNKLNMKTIPYTANTEGIVSWGDNMVGRLIEGGGVQFL